MKNRLIKPKFKWVFSGLPFLYGWFAFIKNEFLEQNIRENLQMLDLLNIIEWYWYVIIGLLIFIILTFLYEPLIILKNKIIYNKHNHPKEEHKMDIIGKKTVVKVGGKPPKKKKDEVVGSETIVHVSEDQIKNGQNIVGEKTEVKLGDEKEDQE